MIGKCLIAEKSKLTCFGPRRLSRPQLPKVPATGLENAAGLYHPFWIGIRQNRIHAGNAVEAFAAGREGHAGRIP